MTASAPSSDIAFTDTVKSIQALRGSRRSYGRIEEAGGFRTTITSDLAAFLAEVDTAYLATSNAKGQPYAQHRGGPRGFIRVIDATTLAFADYVGNRQYITTGNLAENDKAFLFLMDYANRRRIKLWGRARTISDNAELIASLMPDDCRAVPEQAIVFQVLAWDSNCPKHIPRKLDIADVEASVSELRTRLVTTEAENAMLRAQLAQLTHDQSLQKGSRP